MKKIFLLILVSFLLIGCNSIQDELGNNMDRLYLTGQIP